MYLEPRKTAYLFMNNGMWTEAILARIRSFASVKFVKNSVSAPLWKMLTGVVAIYSLRDCSWIRESLFLPISVWSHSSTLLLNLKHQTNLLDFQTVSLYVLGILQTPLPRRCYRLMLVKSHLTNLLKNLLFSHYLSTSARGYKRSASMPAKLHE